MEAIVDNDYMPEEIQEINDLQTINVAMEELPEPSQPFYDWLEKVTSEEKGKSFFNWLLN